MSPAEDLTLEKFLQIIEADDTRKLTEGYRKALADWEATQRELDEEALAKAKRTFEAITQQTKRQLPQASFQAHFLPGTKRSNDNAHDHGMAMLDYDHVLNPREMWLSMSQRLTPEDRKRIRTVYVTPSGQGLRIVFDRGFAPEGMTLAQHIERSQRLMANLLGNPDYDKACKDPARISFLVPREDFILLDEELLLTPSNMPAMQEENQTTTQAATPTTPSQLEPCFKEVPYARIIEEWFKLNGGTPQEGERHTKLFQLATHLTHITDFNPQVIRSILPDLGLPDSEMNKIANDAAKTDQNYLPRKMRQALSAAGVPGYTLANDSIDEDNDDTPPAMPDELPPLIELLIKHLPDKYRPAVARMVFPALGAHMCQTAFRYVDNQLHEPTLMGLLMAPSSSGKSCVNEPINRIMRDIRAKDKIAREKQQQWKDKKQQAAANERTEKRPTDMIQEVMPDMTTAGLRRAALNAEPHFLYTHCNELSQFDRLDDRDNIFNLAFDYNNLWGATRSSTEAMDTCVCLRYNWTACCVIDKARLWFRDKLITGPLSRIFIAGLPTEELGAELPIYGLYEDDFDHQLAPYINALTQARGEFVAPQLTQLANTIVKRAQEATWETQSAPYWAYARRAAVIAWLQACVLYTAQGQQYDERIQQFALWSYETDMYFKMRFFGDMVQKELSEQPITHYKPTSIFSELPQTFTREEYLKMAQKRGIRRASNVLSNWKQRGKIKINPDGTYTKMNA